MKNIRHIVSFIVLPISFSLIGCADNSQRNGTPAVFETEAEAIKAAKDFNCAGAHRMGNKWMPCKSHDAHSEHHHH